MKHKLLITGGCGFIGTNLIKHIIEEGHYFDRFESILVYDNLSTGHFIEGIHDHDKFVKVIFIEGDIRNGRHFSDIFNSYQPTEVLHLAGLVSIYDCNNHPADAWANNLIGSIPVVQACAENDIKLIAAETSAVYEGCNMPPYHETESYPVTVYSQTKAALANMIKSAHKQYGMQYNLLRFFNVAGVFQDYRRTVPALHCGFVARILQDKPVIIFGDGDRRRDFIHVWDVCEFILNKCILTDEYANRTFNVGTGQSTSLHEIREMIYNQMNIPICDWQDPIILPEINGEAFDIYACINEAQSTGWHPQKTMSDIISDTIAYISNEIKVGNIPENFMDDTAQKLDEVRIG